MVAAAKLINKGNMIGANATGFVLQGDTIANGCTKILGKCSAKYDNSAGIDGAISAHFELGIFEWANSSTDAVAQADLWNVVYCQDGVTIAKTSNGGLLVPAGILTEITHAGDCAVFMAPWVSDFAVGAANGNAAAAGQIQKRSLVIPHTALTAAATTQAINLGAALPANARILGAELYALTPFTGAGVTALTASIGTTADATAIVNAADCFAAAVDGQTNTRPLGKAPNKLFVAAGAQLQALFTSTGANLSLVGAGTGTVTIDVLFAVLP